LLLFSLEFYCLLPKSPRIKTYRIKGLILFVILHECEPWFLIPRKEKQKESISEQTFEENIWTHREVRGKCEKGDIYKMSNFTNLYCSPNTRESKSKQTRCVQITAHMEMRNAYKLWDGIPV
jgi:hypothetical protein